MVQHVTKHAKHVTFGGWRGYRTVPAAMFFGVVSYSKSYMIGRSVGLEKGKRGERGKNKTFNFPAALGSIFRPKPFIKV